MNNTQNNLTDNDNTINNGSKDHTVVDELANSNTPNNLKNISKGSTLSNMESQGIEYNKKAVD